MLRVFYCVCFHAKLAKFFRKGRKSFGCFVSSLRSLPAFAEASRRQARNTTATLLILPAQNQSTLSHTHC